MSGPDILIIDELSLGLAPVVAEGRTFTEAPPTDLAAKPEIRRAYLGL